jgi:hypothetical protein
MTKPAKPTRKKSSSTPPLLTIADVAQKLDMSYHEARNFLIRVPIAKTGARGAHLYTLEAVTEARKTSANESGNEAQPGTKEWHEVEKIRRQVEKLDVELDGLRGKMLDREEVRRATMALCMEFAKHLDEMESKLAPMVAGLTPTEAQPVIIAYNAKLRETLRAHTKA